MKKILAEIQSGEFAREFISECRANSPTLKAKRRQTAEQPVEQIGEKLRAMMPWISQNRLVDRRQKLMLSAPLRRIMR